MQEVLLGAAAALAACAQFFFVYRGVKRQTTIDPTGWIIWSGLGLVLITTQVFEAGWQPALAISFVHLAGNTFVVYLARNYGKGGLKAADWLAIAVAVVGVTLWGINRDAAWGVWFAIGADCVGVAKVWQKAWRDAPTEPLMTWVMGTVAASCAFYSAAVSGKDILVAYPLYVIGNSAGSVLIIVLRRAWMRRPAYAPPKTLEPATAGEVA